MEIKITFFPLSYPRPVSTHTTAGSNPSLLSPILPNRDKKVNTHHRKMTGAFSGWTASALLPFLILAFLLLRPQSISSSSSQSSSSSEGARASILPTLVSRKKVRTAGVAQEEQSLADVSTHGPSRHSSKVPYLRGPGSAIHEQVVARLVLAAATPPELAGLDHVGTFSGI